MSRRVVVVLAVAGFLLAAIIPAAMATEVFTPWTKIPVTYVNRCGYVRTHVDNSLFLAAATTKSVSDTGGCDPGNSPVTLDVAWLGVSAELINESTSSICGGDGSYIYNFDGRASQLPQTVYNIGGSGCSNHSAEDYYAWSVGLMFRQSDNQYYGVQVVSDDLLFT